MSGNTYSSQFIRGNACDYENTTGLKRGLKTASRFLVPVSGQPLNWQTQRQETYSYDSNLDYLVGASYGDGLPNANVTWGYDAAGNRISDSAQPGTWSYDNLNRMTASPGADYTNDILGNRLSKTLTNAVVSDTMNWDILNRMTSFRKDSAQSPTYYAYRADGLRVKKVSSSQQNPNTTLYRYDGQMSIEEFESNANGAVSINRNTFGARGVDLIQRATPTVNETSYPLYDAHGNMTAQLLKNGSSFTVANEKSYDAWGGIRAGNSNPEYKGRYCAKLGHVQDDESGLIYMRARYYEPGTGRFNSQDPALDGENWFSYCGNDPINFGDANGKSRFWLSIGDFEVSFDFYTPSGTSDSMCDLHWRNAGENLKNGRGSTRIDGLTKHGEAMPNELRELLIKGEGKAGKKYLKTCKSMGLPADSIRASFNVDPLETLSIIALALWGLDLVWNKDAWAT